MQYSCCITNGVLSGLPLYPLPLNCYYNLKKIYYYYFFLLYNIVLVLPNIKMNPPQVYMCSPSWTLLLLPSPYHPSGSSQCTSPKHPVSCIEPGLATRFIYDIIRISIYACVFYCHHTLALWFIVLDLLSWTEEAVLKTYTWLFPNMIALTPQVKNNIWKLLQSI